MEGQGGTAGSRLAPNPLAFQRFVKDVRAPKGVMPPYTEKLLNSQQDLADIHALPVHAPEAGAGVRDGGTYQRQVAAPGAPLRQPCRPIDEEASRAWPGGVKRERCHGRVVAPVSGKREGRHGGR